MTYKLGFPETFLTELTRAPKHVVNSWSKTVGPRLRSDPNTQDPPAIKKLKGWKDQWRYRVGDWRLIYKVDESRKEVTLRMLGHRKDVYDRLGHGESGPKTWIIANSDLKDEIERDVSDKERGEALVDNESEARPDEPSGAPIKELPKQLQETDLLLLNIPDQFHEDILSVRTEGELLGLSGRVPDECIERIMNFIWPPTIEQVIAAPVRELINDKDFELLANGDISLESMLLRLDDSQRPFVNQFEITKPSGPWMLKGGPGSGKSTVILNCIRGLLEQGSSSLDLEGAEQSILFTTFTKSLVSAAGHLVESFDIGKSRFVFEAVNTDKLVTRHLPRSWDGIRPVIQSDRICQEFIVSAIEQCSKKDKKFVFTSRDGAFLIDEIEWVVLGDNIHSQEEYIAADRRGRGRILGKNQRAQVWNFYQALLIQLRGARRCLISQRLVAAEKVAKPTYDYVFIDEAQDLKPVAIRCLLKLAKDSKNVFLTADANQTIYGASMTWKKVSKALNFRGRTKILRMNYRTTTDVWKAIKPIAANLPDIDRETMDAEPVYIGSPPTLAHVSSLEEEANVLSSWIRSYLIRHRLPASCAAILCPTNKHCCALQNLLDKQLRAKAFSTGNLDLSYSGVKLLTMHAAKGLQFPIVVVTGLEKGKMPWPAYGGMDKDEQVRKQQRLFFVACSRAMRRLLVCGSKDRPSEFLSYLDPDLWEPYER